jgi:hypothetical protein
MEIEEQEFPIDEKKKSYYFKIINSDLKGKERIMSKQYDEINKSKIK